MLVDMPIVPRCFLRLIHLFIIIHLFSRGFVSLLRHRRLESKDAKSQHMPHRVENVFKNNMSTLILGSTHSMSEGAPNHIKDMPKRI